MSAARGTKCGVGPGGKRGSDGVCGESGEKEEGK